jgi:hypothetical protein
MTGRPQPLSVKESLSWMAFYKWEAANAAK